MAPAVHASQNIYDDPAVFDCYSTFPRSQHGLDTAKGGAPEWPVLKQIVLGDGNDSSNQNSIERTMLRGSKVLDLGCGYGWFCRWVRDEVGAEEVVGIDISERMLARARNFGSRPFPFPSNSHPHAQEEKRKENEATIVHDEDTRIRYERGDLETIRLSDLSGGAEDVYDLIYSSLSFHYISDFRRLAKEISTVLKPGGKLVFSIEHPIFTAPREAEWKMLKKKGSDLGTYVENQGESHTDLDPDPLPIWPLNAYSTEGLRLTAWLGMENVRKYHRTTATYITSLLEAGLELTHLVDWAPSEELMRTNPKWAVHCERPMFMLVGARKRDHLSCTIE